MLLFNGSFGGDETGSSNFRTDGEMSGSVLAFYVNYWLEVSPAPPLPISSLTSHSFGLNDGLRCIELNAGFWWCRAPPLPPFYFCCTFTHFPVFLHLQPQD